MSLDKELGSLDDGARKDILFLRGINYAEIRQRIRAAKTLTALRPLTEEMATYHPFVERRTGSVPFAPYVRDSSLQKKHLMIITAWSSFRSPELFFQKQ